MDIPTTTTRENPVSVIKHLQACEDELLGKVVRLLMERGDGDLLRLNDAVHDARAARETLPDRYWTCACGRIQLATLTTRVDTARKQGAAEYQELLAERRKLSALLNGGEGE